MLLKNVFNLNELPTKFKFAMFFSYCSLTDTLVGTTDLTNELCLSGNGSRVAFEYLTLFKI